MTFSDVMKLWRLVFGWIPLHNLLQSCGVLFRSLVEVSSILQNNHFLSIVKAVGDCPCGFYLFSVILMYSFIMNLTCDEKSLSFSSAIFSIRSIKLFGILMVFVVNLSSIFYTPFLCILSEYILLVKSLLTSFVFCCILFL